MNSLGIAEHWKVFFSKGKDFPLINAAKLCIYLEILLIESLINQSISEIRESSAVPVLLPGVQGRAVN